MPQLKETNFFAFEGQKVNFAGPGDNEYINSFSVTERSKYHALFSTVENQTAIGEASPLYLYSDVAPHRIKSDVPNVKMICVLRNPIERAFSHYLHFLRDGRESLSFEQALAQEHQRRSMNWEWAWNYVDVGFYAAQLTRYYHLFSPNQIKVYLYEELQSRPGEIIADMFEFIGVDPAFVPDMSVRPNRSGVPNSRFLRFFLFQSSVLKSMVKPLVPKKSRSAIRKAILSRDFGKPEMGEEVRQMLVRTFKDDIQQLEHLLGRDLNHWLVNGV